MDIEKELKKFKNRVKFAKKAKRYDYLWKDMKMARQISFYKVETVKLGKMGINI